MASQLSDHSSDESAPDGNVEPKFCPSQARKTMALKKSVAGWAKYGEVDRGEWWKCQIKPYPPPGLYSQPTFLEMLDSNPIKSTYGFLNNGRKKSDFNTRKGRLLLPGAYDHHNHELLNENKSLSYCFKVSPRRSRDLLKGLIDKNLDLFPGQYNIHQYLSINPEAAADKITVFKSKSQRFPSKPFQPRIGPSPCEYNVSCPLTTTSITSSFKSSCPRFGFSHTKVPGPGTYYKSYQSPPPPEIRQMGRQHGLFFNSTFCN